MSDTTAAIRTALDEVWLRHRSAVLADLQQLIDDLETWNTGTCEPNLAHDIRSLAHRILGSLSMVGRDERAADLRLVEQQAIDGRGLYAKEVVERVHDLLAFL